MNGHERCQPADRDADGPTTNGHADRPAAVVLLSGGLDSATTLAMACDQGFACHGLTFDYQQRHRAELQAASRIARAWQLQSHRVIQIDLRALGGSALTDDIDVPKDRTTDQMSQDIPVTYVPARNTIFLAYALALAEVIEARDIFIGVNAVDYSGYPDCRKPFTQAFEQMANLATRAGVQGQHLTIHTPLIELTKVQIIETGLKLGVDYSMTHSCYDPVAVPVDASDATVAPPTVTQPRSHRVTADGSAFSPDSTIWRPCGRCDSCQLRRQAFAALGMADPAEK